MINQVIKDLEKLELDRLDKEGHSQTRKLWDFDKWLEDAYLNTLRSAIALRQLIDERKKETGKGNN